MKYTKFKDGIKKMHIAPHMSFKDSGRKYTICLTEDEHIEIVGKSGIVKIDISKELGEAIELISSKDIELE